MRLRIIKVVKANSHKTCCQGLQMEIVRSHFPDVYEDFLKLLVFLNMELKAKATASKALRVAGINQRLVYQQLGLLEEKNENCNAALNYYKKAYAYSLEKEDADDSKLDIERITAFANFVTTAFANFTTATFAKLSTY